MGIALGVATIVALLSLGEGLKQTASGLIHLGDSDFAVFQHGVEDPTASFLPNSVVKRVGQTDGVKSATPIMLLVEKIKSEPGSIVFGTTPQGSMANRLVVLAGRKPAKPGEIALGEILAKRMKLGVGSTMKVGPKKLKVVGTYSVVSVSVDSRAARDLQHDHRA